MASTYSSLQNQSLSASKNYSPAASIGVRTSSTGKKDKQKWGETLTRKIGASKKNTKEVEELEEAGKAAIDGPSSPSQTDAPGDFLLEEGQERYMVEKNVVTEPAVKQLCDKLMDWINDVLADRRIVVKNIQEDLFDGQILAILIERLCNVQLGQLTGVTQSFELQKERLTVIVDQVNQVLGIPADGSQLWTADLIHKKHIPAILHLLVAMCRQFNGPKDLPSNVTINVVVVQKRNGILRSKTVPENVTGNWNLREARTERDAFDTLFDHAPDKLVVVKKSLQGFVNKHLSKLDLEIDNLDSQFGDGVNFVLLIGLLEGYFVPLHLFHMTPQSLEQKCHNIEFALNLIEDAGLPKPRVKAEDIVNCDLKATLRVLYTLFTKYKNVK